MTLYYVSAVRGGRDCPLLLAGPYRRHEDALDQVEFIARQVMEQDRSGRAHFWAYGTAGSEEPMATVMLKNARRPFRLSTQDFGGGHIYYVALDALGRPLAQGERHIAEAVIAMPTPDDDLFSYPAEKVE